MKYLKAVSRIALLEGPATLGFPRTALWLFDRSLFEPDLRGLKIAARLAENDVDARIRYAESAIKYYPDHPHGYKALRDCLLEIGDVAAANQVLTRAPNSGGKKGSGKTGKSATPAKLRPPKFLSNWNAFQQLFPPSDDSLEFVRAVPESVKQDINYHLALADLEMQQNKLNESLATLRAAQTRFPMDRRILNRIASLYRDNGQYEHALSFYRAGRVVDGLVGAMRVLAFLADTGQLALAEAQILGIAKFTAKERLRFAPNWNRITQLFPEHEPMFQEWRREAFLAFQTQTAKDPRDLARLVRIGIKLRLIDDTFALVERSKAAGIDLDDAAALWLDKIAVQIEPLKILSDTATFNETRPGTIGFSASIPIDIDDAVLSGDKTVVELFIPTAFFAADDEEKPTYETVRQTFSIIAAQLLSDPSVILVPRQQYNWRNAAPRLNRRVLSYHTNGEYSEDRLHLQETALAGRCSLDHKGFAAFSSIAEDFSAIEKDCEAVSRDQLIACHAELRARYVDGNISKYAQAEDSDDLPDGKYVFLALQVQTDIVAQRAYLPGIELLEQLAEHYRGTGVAVVVKRHPYCASMTMESRLAELAQAGLIRQSNASIHQLISNADAVFTVNSGVGLEALLHFKPVVVTGACDYAYAVKTAHDAAELASLLNGEIHADETRILKLLYFYANRYTIAPDPSSVQPRLERWLRT